MQLLDPNRISRRQYQTLINELGGKFSFLQRIKMGGTGIGGLTLQRDQQPNLPLRFPDATETVRVSIEILRKGIILGFNNTKEVKILPLRNPQVRVAIQLENSPQKVRKKAIVQLQIDAHQLKLHTNGWNHKEVVRYFDKLQSQFHKVHN